ncbi:CoA transferase [Blastococcus sp. SYSU D00820]
MSSVDQVAEYLARAAWHELTDEDLPQGIVRTTGTAGLPSSLPVAGLAVGAVTTQLLAARRLAGHGRPRVVRLDAAHVGVSFRSERHVRLGDRSVGPGFAPLSRFLRTADGWIRLHANYPHHRDAVLSVLGPDPEAAAVGAAARDLEAAIVAAGGAAAAVRSRQEWAGSPQGQVVAALPLLSLRQVADGPRRAVRPGGLRVLDLTRVIAGPVAGRTLASHGADVLRVDDPERPDDAGGLLDTGVGKRHVLLDFRSPTDRRVLEDLLAGADAVLQGYRPGALARWGLDPESLRARHPHLAVVALSAWGWTGPWRSRRGFDSIVQAATGIADLCAADGIPGALPVQALDHATGHLAAAATMSAVTRSREQGGTWHGDLSLARTAHWLLTAPPPDEATAQGEAAASVDPQPYLATLPSAAGTVTVVRPPGSPLWRRAALLPDRSTPAWDVDRP